MNIKRAKEEIRDTIEAYLLKDEYGDYVIPQVRQRPVLLLGAPGIGKTQIMEQVARECGVGLVAYTITHHTRQSAIGLPFVSKTAFGGKEYTVTEYTMSEIVASIYKKMEQTGLKEGILFIDEINCVSETLAPAMLQFLQCKTFGNHEIPQGWIIVAAGNPPEYNKSVREFDVVTMDRVKKIEVEPDFSVWKEYAVREQLHPAILSYLNTRTGNFYKMETTVDGRHFATPRGWEDLSNLLQVYDRLGKKMDREVVIQYIQHEMIAKDFANYLELFRKYQLDYQMEEVLAGRIDPSLLKKASHASFDERLSVVSLLLARCRGKFAALVGREKMLELVFERLKTWKDGIAGSDRKSSLEFFRKITAEFQGEIQQKKTAELLTRTEERICRGAVGILEGYLQRLQLEETWVETESDQQKEDKRAGSEVGQKKEGKLAGCVSLLTCVNLWFAQEQDDLDAEFEAAGQMLEHAFDFVEAAYGNGQEMVVFITELNSDFYSTCFLQEYECERYYRYNQQLLFEEGSRSIEARLRALGR